MKFICIKYHFASLSVHTIATAHRVSHIMNIKYHYMFKNRHLTSYVVNITNNKSAILVNNKQRY